VRSVNPDGSVVCESAAAANAIYQPAMRPWVLDLGSLGANYCCYLRGFTDGTNGYLVPFGLNGVAGNQGRLVRFNMDAFTTAATSSVDVAAVDPNAVGFIGGFTDGRYAWLVPFNGSKAARVDLANFGTGGVRAVDFATIDPALTGFSGGFSNGKYGVMVPSYMRAVSGFYQKAVRIQLQEGAGTQ